MPRHSPVQRAVNFFEGSPTKLAAAVGGGVVRQHVEHWLKKGRVPPEHCAPVFELTGVPVWELRPDDWQRIWPMLVGTPGAPLTPQTAEPARSPEINPGQRATDKAGV